MPQNFFVVLPVAEVARRHLSGQIFVGGTNNAHVYRFFGGFTNATHGFFLNCPQ